MTVDDVIARMREQIRIRHLAWSTEKSYIHWARRYARFAAQLRRDLPAEEKFRSFLSALAQDDVSASTQSQAFNAVLFLYREVLGVQLGKVDAMRARRGKHERYSPSRDQVRSILSQVVDAGGYPVKLIVSVLYGCGLRLNEGLEIRIKDLLLDRGQVVIRQAKGAKDRVVPIPPSLRDQLSAQSALSAALWARDSANRIPVPLPGRLAVKYPQAQFERGWYWLFPATGMCSHPRTGERMRWHVHPSAIQRAVRSASRKAGVDGVTPHCLRHAYATHAIEMGAAVTDVSKVMGHVHLDTTAGYIHAEAMRVRSPLEVA